ncbi:hypothetical protein Tco_0685290, partial [Tanacetum coccineum]
VPETKPHPLFVGVKPKRMHPKWVVDGDEGDGGGERCGDEVEVMVWRLLEWWWRLVA